MLQDDYLMEDMDDDFLEEIFRLEEDLEKFRNISLFLGIVGIVIVMIVLFKVLGP
jgi:hypothetical protein